MRSTDLDRGEYQKLEAFRFQIRRFLNFSETAARESGIEAQQHQAMLVLRAVPEGIPPTIGYLAERLLLQHSSAVGLVDRMQALKLIKRNHNPEDARQVLVNITAKGQQILHNLSVEHRAELEESGPKLASALHVISAKRKRPKT